MIDNLSLHYKMLLLGAKSVPKVVVIDDDYSTEIIVENLSFHGYDAKRIASFEAAQVEVADIIKADLAILDIIMERSQASGRPAVSGNRTTGMELFRQMRRLKPKFPILVFSGTTDPVLIEAIERDPHAKFLSKWNTPSLNDLLSAIQALTGRTVPIAPKPRSFIVHGHDTAEKLALKNYLQNTLGLPEPIILHEQASVGRTIIEKLETFAMTTDVVFVLLTPDDKVSSGDGTNDEKRRARQNVIFEMGYFLGVFGRLSGRVVLLYKGRLDLPSDLAGVIYVDISNGIEAAGEIIRREIANVS
jgi:CheY-like chemotaxis protein